MKWNGQSAGTGFQWYIGVGKEILLGEFQQNGIGIMFTFGGGSWKDSDTHQKWSQLGPGFQCTWTYN